MSNSGAASLRNSTKKHGTRVARRAILALCAAAASGPAARAVTYSWDGGASHMNVTADNAWSTGNNWVAGAAPSSNINDDFDFTLSGLRTTSNQDVAGIFLLHSITFDSTSNVTALTGNTLDFFTNGSSVAPSFAQNSATAVSVSNAFTLTNTLTRSGTGDVTFGGAITGSGGLIHTGTGTTTITGGNSYTGNTTVNAGAVNVTTGGALLNSLVSVGAGGTVTVTGGTITAGTAAFVQLGATSSSLAASFNLTSGAVSSTETDVANAPGSKGTFGQSGGTQAVAGGLFLGVNSGSAGVYNLSGPSALTTANTYVGDFGAGTFNQTGGTHSIATLLHMGQNAAGGGTGSGLYNLAGGLLTTGGVTQSAGGTGTFDFNGGTLQASAASATFIQGLTAANVQAGGAVIDTQGFAITIAQALLHDPGLGATADGGLTKNGTGTLTLAGAGSYTGPTNVIGGTLAVTTGGALSNTVVGVGPGATFSLSGGSVTEGSAVYFQVGSQINSTAAFATLSSGNLSSGETDVGNAAGSTGTFNQSGGTHTVSGGLYVGVGTSSIGTYNLSGTGQLLTNGDYIGKGGTGTFNQSGGTQTVTGGLHVAYGGPGSDVYSLSGASALSTTDSYVGDLGSGTFIQSGGTHSITNLLHFGDSGGATGGTGTYTLSGGTLIVAALFRGAGSGIFNFNGGTLQPAAATTTFFQGLTTAAVQSGGALINTNGFDITVAQPLLHSAALGATHDGGVTKSGNGTLTLTGTETYTGPTTVSGGTLTMSPTSSVTASQILVALGATFNLNGGVISDGGTAGAVQVGAAGSPGTASFNQSGGVLSSAETDVGEAPLSTGIFGQTGGTHAVTALYLGNASGAKGVYQLSSPGQLLAGDIYVGSVGFGTFTESAGSATIFNALHMTVQSSGIGTYQLSGGTLTTPQIVEGAGSGTFYFNGGTLVPSASSSTFMQGITAADIQAGAANINTNALNITIAEPLQHDTASLGSTADGGVVKTGSGNLTLTGTSSYTGGTTVNAGLLVFAAGARPAGDKLTLNLTTTTGPKAVIQGDSANLGSYRTALQAAFGTAEQWQGTPTTLATTSARVTSGIATQGIGYETGAEYLLLHSATGFASNYTVATTDVLLKYTYMGDATLDGKITVADYAQIDSGFLLGGAADWLRGDFNYDGVVNYLDYALIDAAFHAQSGPLADEEIALHTSEFGGAYVDALDAALNATSAAPEPGSLVLMAPVVLLGRRGKGRKRG